VPPSERRERPPRQAADVASSSRFAAGPEAAAAYATAEQAMREGRWADALPMLERVAAAEPGSVRSGNALMDLGRAAARAGREDLAARAYERYLAEQPGGPLREAARFALCRLRGEGGASCADTGVGSPE
jgi:outer membrane protein assembly factor BamD (BamD/ComL family)